MNWNNLVEKSVSYSVILGSVMWAGIQSQRIEELFTKAHASKETEDKHGEILYDIHGKVCKIETRLDDLIINNKPNN